MTKSQLAFLTFISKNFFNASAYLTDAGTPPTEGMQRIAFIELRAYSATLRITMEEFAPIASCVEPGSVVQGAWVLTDKGRKVMEDHDAG